MFVIFVMHINSCENDRTSGKREVLGQDSDLYLGDDEYYFCVVKNKFFNVKYRAWRE